MARDTIETVKRVMNGDFSDASPEERDKAVREVLEICSIAAGAVTIQPIPFVDIALISPIQIALVQAVGRVYGYSLDKKSVLEILSTFGASLLAQGAIMAAAKFIPFIGWVVVPAMSFALTWAIGEVSAHYFKNGRGVSQEELKSMFDRVYQRKKDEKTQQHKSNTTLKERLEQLKEARREGLLTDEEFEAKKADILKDF